MWTDVQVANKALARIGVHRQLSSLTDGSSEAAAVNEALDRCKDALLAAHHWSWATLRADLGLVATYVEGSGLPGWTYVYDLPAGFATAIEIWPGPHRPAASERVPFALGIGTDKTSTRPMLFTDEEEPTLLYVPSIYPTAYAPAVADDALAWALAAELAMVLTQKAELSAHLSARAERALQVAIAHDRNGQQLAPEPEPCFITARY